MPRRSIARLGRTAVVAIALVLIGPPSRGHTQDEQRRDVTITAGAGAYDPAQIEVRENEILSVTFVATDAPHSLNIDAYRIAKRAEPGSPARFELRAERAGRFPSYCNLTAPDGRAHQMRGELVVRK